MGQAINMFKLQNNVGKKKEASGTRPAFLGLKDRFTEMHENLMSRRQFDELYQPASYSLGKSRKYHESLVDAAKDVLTLIQFRTLDQYFNLEENISEINLESKTISLHFINHQDRSFQEIFHNPFFGGFLSHGYTTIRTGLIKEHFQNREDTLTLKYKP